MVVFNSSLLEESLIRLSQAGKQIPGGGVSPSCIEKWIRQGIGGVTLEVCRVGHIRYTSREAIHRFLESVNRTSGVVTVE